MTLATRLRATSKDSLSCRDPRATQGYVTARGSRCGSAEERMLNSLTVPTGRGGYPKRSASFVSLVTYAGQS
jgi:hypothetical protein